MTNPILSLRNQKFLIFFSLILTLLFSSCAGREHLPQPFSIPRGLEKILIISFKDVSKGDGENEGIRCPLSGKTFMTGPVEAGAEDLLTDRLKTLMKERREFKFISSEQLQDIQYRLSAQKKVSERSILIAAGNKLGADAVFAGHIYRFKDRVGGKFSVESPASVAFDLHFVRVSDGRVLWSGHFDETQKALTDDLFQLPSFLKRDGQWITAEQMALTGLEKIVEVLNLQ